MKKPDLRFRQIICDKAGDYVALTEEGIAYVLVNGKWTMLSMEEYDPDEGETN